LLENLTVPYLGTLLMEPEPERECWHEAGHAVVAHHLGMRVNGIGFTWVKGPEKEPYPSAFVPVTGSDKEAEATVLMAGSAAEILKCGDYDHNGRKYDIEKLNELHCGHPPDHHIGQAIEILRQRDSELRRVYEELMTAMAGNPKPTFRDKQDGLWKQVRLNRDAFETLMAGDSQTS
jgi:hypothetical protein